MIRSRETFDEFNAVPCGGASKKLTTGSHLTEFSADSINGKIVGRNPAVRLELEQLTLASVRLSVSDRLTTS